MNCSLRAKVRNAYIEGGLPLILLRFLKKNFRGSSAFWYTRNLDEPIVYGPGVVSVSIVEGDIEVVLDYIKKKDCYIPNEVELIIEENHIYFGLVHDGAINGFCKFGRGRVFINDFRRIVRFPESLGFIYECEVDAQIRGKRAGRFMISSVLETAKRLGLRKVMCHIPAWNLASQRMFSSCGFLNRKCIRYVSVFGLGLYSANLARFLRREAD